MSRTPPEPEGGDLPGSPNVELERPTLAQRWLEAEADAERALAAVIAAAAARNRETRDIPRPPESAPEDETAPIGVFGRMYLAIMQEYQPLEYRRLEASGRLHRLAKIAERRGKDHYSQVFRHLHETDPMPPDMDYVRRVQHQMTLASMAREVVFDDMLKHLEIPAEGDGAPEA